MGEFQFTACLEIKELTGKKAEDEQELLDLIEEVSEDSIYFHTHSCFLRHRYISGLYPNDFADWATLQVRDRVLGEKLGEITPEPNKTIEDIRTEIVDLIDNHLSSINVVPAVVYGHPFYFMQSRIIEVPTGITVSNLAEFTEVFKTINTSAIYNHMFEARIRNKRGRSDFALWISDALGNKQLADKIEAIDSYMYSLESLRSRILEICAKELS